MDFNKTPRANRVHIAFFGKTNAGKSSLINAIANQEVSIVSEQKGTTTDPVYKSMELKGVGAVELIDTAGYGDDTSLGEKRREKTQKIMSKTDIAVIVAVELYKYELTLIEELKNICNNTILVINKIDNPNFDKKNYENTKEMTGLDPLFVSAKTKDGVNTLLDKIISICDQKDESITGHLVKDSDTVMLVMPQDIQAPKGRLILPQVQTIRDLLENKCTVICTTKDRFVHSLSVLKNPPDLIITDSQIFSYVYGNKPAKSELTSFSVLFSRYKGDIGVFVKGAKKIASLKDGDKVLIAEACTHKPLDGDIARIKLPKLLARTTGKELNIKVVSGDDFPDDLSEYSLVIHCGACMFNKKHVLTRISKCEVQDVPITNYGIAIAYMNDILDKIKL